MEATSGLKNVWHGTYCTVRVVTCKCSAKQSNKVQVTRSGQREAPKCVFFGALQSVAQVAMGLDHREPYRTRTRATTETIIKRTKSVLKDSFGLYVYQ